MFLADTLAQLFPQRGARIAAWAAATAVYATHASGNAGPAVLLDFDRGIPTGAEAVFGGRPTFKRARTGTVLRIEGGPSQKWPGVTSNAPEAGWDLSAAQRLAIDVRNVGASWVRVGIRFDAPDANDKTRFRYTIADIAPGKTETVWVAVAPTPPLDIDGTPIESEPCSGRDLDGENGQLGFVDICDSPYPEAIAAAREVGRCMYRFRAKGSSRACDP